MAYLVNVSSGSPDIMLEVGVSVLLGRGAYGLIDKRISREQAELTLNKDGSVSIHCKGKNPVLIMKQEKPNVPIPLENDSEMTIKDGDIISLVPFDETRENTFCLQQGKGKGKGKEKHETRNHKRKVEEEEEEEKKEEEEEDDLPKPKSPQPQQKLPQLPPQPQQKPPRNNRSPCKYAESCYRKNEDHKVAYSHPGDPDYDSKKSPQKDSNDTSPAKKQKQLKFLAGTGWSITGNHSLSRKDLQNKIRQYGGSTYENISNSVTHLLSTQNQDSGKVKKAKEMGISVVSEDFLDKCITEGKLLNAKPFLLV